MIQERVNLGAGGGTIAVGRESTKEDGGVRR